MAIVRPEQRNRNAQQLPFRSLIGRSDGCWFTDYCTLGDHRKVVRTIALLRHRCSIGCVSAAVYHHQYKYCLGKTLSLEKRGSFLPSFFRLACCFPFLRTYSSSAARGVKSIYSRSQIPSVCFTLECRALNQIEKCSRKANTH